MRSFNRLIVALIVNAALTACAHYELIRSSSGPSHSMDHCPVCMDLGQAWAFFRLRAYEQADEYCTLVIEGEADPSGKHVRRARDISLLSRGFLSLRDRDYPTAAAFFREISDPQLRALGQPHVDSEGYVPPWRSGSEDLRSGVRFRRRERSNSLYSRDAL